jgi:hypothetical protein
MARKKKKLSQADIDMDMTPMIDVVFLLIIFFILAGRITSEMTNEQITVPPTRTAEEKPDLSGGGWERIKIEVWGSTQENAGSNIGGGGEGHKIQLGGEEWESEGFEGQEAFNAYQGMRTMLDSIYVAADKYDDPNKTGIELPKVVVELRADAFTEYRVIQEIQQVITDSISPFPDDNGQYMTPRKDFRNGKPFVNLEFTTRKPGDSN